MCYEHAMGIRTLLGLKKPLVSPFASSRVTGHSQLDQDLWALTDTDWKCGGFFVEIGAFDGVTFSNTLLLEKFFGWRGILAEPNPLMTEHIREARTAPLCVQPVDAVSGREVTMLFVAGAPELSAMKEHASKDNWAAARKDGVPVTQTTVSLNDLLTSYDAPSEIDFVSIDTEGSEPDILSTFDFDRYRVRLFCVEHNDTGSDEITDKIMFARGYERVHRKWSRWDAWYRHS